MVEEMSGLTRVKSSLELLSHTASLKSEIEAKEEKERLLETAGRVSPASTSEDGGTTTLPSIFVSPRDTFGKAGDSGYSIEGYASTDDNRDDNEDLSPIPSQPAENLSAYLARGRGGGGTALPMAISTGDTGSFLLKFQGSSGKASEALGRRDAGFLLHAASDDGQWGNHGLLSASFSSSSDLQVPSHQSHIDRLERENGELRHLVATKDLKIASLEASLVHLEKQVADLRQLPTGKISQIPLEDMLQLMRDYGSELSETAVPPRKDSVQKASVVRQFRRWNPTFFEHFVHKNGKWVPKLGKKGELERRAKARAEAAHKGNKGGSGAAGGDKHPAASKPFKK